MHKKDIFCEPNAKFEIPFFITKCRKVFFFERFCENLVFDQDIVFLLCISCPLDHVLKLHEEKCSHF